MTLARYLIPLLAAAMALPVSAQEAGPDFAEFDGSGGLVFEADERLILGPLGAIEFWVAPEWNADPGYEPVVVSNIGPDGPVYLVSVLATRDGIALFSGSNEAVVAVDFTDDVAHHVAINSYEDGIAVHVDGELKGVFDFSFADLPSYGFFVGTSDGENGNFVGAIGQLRIWGLPLDEEEIRAFATRNLLSRESGDHPAAPSLRAVSDFSASDLLMVDAVAVLPGE